MAVQWNIASAAELNSTMRWFVSMATIASIADSTTLSNRARLCAKIALGLLLCRDVKGGSKPADKSALRVKNEPGPLAHPLPLITGDNLALGVIGRPVQTRLPRSIDHFVAASLDGREKRFVAERRPFRNSENAKILVRPQELLTAHIKAPGAVLLYGKITFRLKVPTGPSLRVASLASGVAH